MLIATGTAAGLLLAGCGGPSTPSVTTTSSGVTTSSSVPSDVPTVPSPDLDTSRFAADPCGMLTTEQVKQVGAGVRGVPEENPLGPSCVWNGKDSAARNTFAVTVNNQIGLADMYARKSSFRVWEPAKVGDRPAVIAMDDDVRSMGHCRLDIATAQKTMVNIDVRLSVAASDRGNPCPRATTIGEMVLATLKG
ncbi:DUF3558 domain-containing protein [Crossiella sp. SN42]|uniref:DUF3558 domain-containing protein n=1 Tax=Crossiella sp. SN42 TaxID=2944808 RepID=UPI00207D6F60|nr:DUF3558 family protein [Crossiella sp. SN42]MCO1578796.1 DUF3558 domain-containing protein [Crossiella sp. SN42]